MSLPGNKLWTDDRLALHKKVPTATGNQIMSFQGFG